MLAVNNALRKHAVFVADAIAQSGQTQARHGIEKTRRQAAQTAIAQTGIRLKIEQGVKVGTEQGAGLFHGLINVGGQHGIGQRAAGEKLQRQVINALGTLVLRATQRLSPAIHDAVAHGMKNGKQPVPWRGRANILADLINQTVGDRSA